MKIPKSSAIEKLNRSISQLDSLARHDNDSPEFSKWHRDTEVAIENIFGSQSRHIKDFSGISFTPSVYYSGMPDSDYTETYRSGLAQSRAVLRSMIDEISEYWSDDVQLDASSPSERAPKNANPSPGGDIFVIRGHDNGFKETVARFLGRLGLNPIILHELASEGKTVIEKFEKHAASARFAIALFSPDDFGGSRGDSTKSEFRARQNVIFEFGYFLGRLGRSHACAIVKGDTTILSDYAGVVYIPYDEPGAWRMLLVKELNSAGIKVDANLAL